MIIKSAEINKFKSINTENNMVFFDKTVTALIITLLERRYPLQVIF